MARQASLNVQDYLNNEVMDFLVESGFIEDDNIFVVEETTTRGIVSKESKIIIEIEELN